LRLKKSSRGEKGIGYFLALLVGIVALHTYILITFIFLIPVFLFGVKKSLI